MTGIIMLQTQCTSYWWQVVVNQPLQPHCLSHVTVYNPSIIKRIQVHSIFSDISKAFDLVLVLLCFKSWRWSTSILNHIINGTQSPTPLVVSIVPQRSVLSPLLFLVYINDITCVISIGKISVYADNMPHPVVLCTLLWTTYSCN